VLALASEGRETSSAVPPHPVRQAHRSCSKAQGARTEAEVRGVSAAAVERHVRRRLHGTFHFVVIRHIVS
jgi:hypothetical protein